MKGLSFYEKNGALTAALSGELDHCLAAVVRARIDDKVSETMPDRLVLDISRITFMDSSGLGLIMGRYALCKSRGIEFRLAGADERAVKILDMAGLCSVIKTEPAVKGSAK
ncbi:MAG: anti-sigma factor antagonist [Clostridia bacterium]|nr:anti-sigma factor antagonist [Clostridia bacterium]